MKTPCSAEEGMWHTAPQGWCELSLKKKLLIWAAVLNQEHAIRC